MGRCCVPNCRGNYDNGPKVRLFSFPRDAKRRAERQRAVRRSDVDVRLLKDPKVCERHFKSEHLRTTSTYTGCDGRTIEAPMKLTRLTPDAFPAIFPDCPSYISDSRTSREEPELKRKRTENELLQKAIHESQAAFEKEEKQYKVCNLGELISRVNERPNKKFWCTTACETCLIVAHIEPALQAPEMLVSVVVTEDLFVSVYFKCAPLVSDDVCIPDEVRDVRVLDNLLDSVERYCEKKARQQEDKQPLFHVVDTVHLLKCIRNNWLNQKDDDKSFLYPPFESSESEVFEAETKIRLQDTLKLKDMPLSLAPKEQELDAEMLIAKYAIKLTQSDLKASQTDVPALAYIAGYCAHAAIKRQPCEDCQSQLMITDRELQQSSPMMDVLERVAPGDDVSDFSDLSESDEEEWIAPSPGAPDHSSEDEEADDFCGGSAVASSSPPGRNWEKALLEIAHPEFSGTFSEPNDLKTPIVIFRRLLTDDMLAILVDQTNIYSTQKYGKSVNTSVPEVEQYIGMYLEMGLVQMPNEFVKEAVLEDNGLALILGEDWFSAA
ncbi:hypothetical protein HPB51_003988 [Rhipicephalus microplus]|uniref:THAP-type domain-containing protein n=1 Tax=Rhipicephalus microplus TaxID=6941 RepID=A0A9J6DTG7_RHIMP|nr:hypothetical protein HPB51_003988 [Rhipicephalus microplus]